MLFIIKIATDSREHTESFDAGQCADSRAQITGSSICLVQPSRQQRLQLAHILEAQLQRLEPTDRSLREDITIQRSEGESHICLGEAQFDPSLFELASECLQVVRGWNIIIIVRWADGGGCRWRRNDRG